MRFAAALTRRLAGLAMLVMGAGALAPVTARAQQPGYPSRPVTIVHPYPAGGVVDVMARLLASEFSRRLGQPFVVESRPGGTYTIAMRSVKRALPDGHTLLMHTNGFTMVQSTVRNTGLDARTDFEPVGLVGEGPFGLFVHASVPAHSVGELVDFARRHPGKLNYGSAGVGGVTHLITARLLGAAGVSMVHVPYAGGPAVMQALLRNDTQVMVWDVPALMRQNKGQLRLLAVTGKDRFAGAPEVPTLQQAGIDVVSSSYMALFAPAGTPSPVLDRLNAALKEVLAAPEVLKALEGMSWTPTWSSRDAARRRVQSEVQDWADTVRAANIPLAE